MKKKILISLVIVVALVGVFGWMYFKFSGSAVSIFSIVNSTKITNPDKPYFPENTMVYIDNEKKWGMSSFQPIFKELLKVDESKYMIIVNYVDGTDGNVKEGNISIGRQIPYYDETGVRVMIDSASLKNKLKKGDQFGVEYLSQVPSDFSKDISHCQTQYVPVECMLAVFKKESDNKGENTFYAFKLYRILKM